MKKKTETTIITLTLSTDVIEKLKEQTRQQNLDNKTDYCYTELIRRAVDKYLGK